MSNTAPITDFHNVFATDLANNIFDLRDHTLNTNHIANLALGLQIRHCWVEFLHTTEVKPKVQFKFNFWNPPPVDQRLQASHRAPPERSGDAEAPVQPLFFKSCLLYMEPRSDFDGQPGLGAPILQLCSDAGRTPLSRATFAFRTNGRLTLLDIIHVIRGDYPGLLYEMSKNLMSFRFVSVWSNGQHHYNGCRDWM